MSYSEPGPHPYGHSSAAFQDRGAILGGAAAQTARDLSIHVSMNRLAKVISGAEEIMPLLADRLALVLHQEPPLPIEKNPQVRVDSVSCALARDLDDYAERVERLSTLLHSILQRLEL